MALTPEQFDQATDQAMHAMREIAARFPSTTLEQMLAVQGGLAAALAAKIQQRHNQQIEQTLQETTRNRFMLAFDDAYQEGLNLFSQNQELDNSEWDWLDRLDSTQPSG